MQRRSLLVSALAPLLPRVGPVLPAAENALRLVRVDGSVFLRGGTYTVSTPIHIAAGARLSN